MKTHQLFIEPLDVLFLRGNKLFGDPGSFGESLVPPWPSVAAGAIRSRMLADDRKVDLSAFARGEIDHPALGTPARPGPFAVAAFHLARRHRDGRIEILFAPPADLVASEDDDGCLAVKLLTPTRPAGGVLASAPFALLPVLAETVRGKPATGLWLTEAGWRDYLSGQVPKADQLVRSDALWKLDHRVGVGLEAATGRAADGLLFSVQALAMVKRGHRIGTDGPSGNPVLADYDLGFLAAVAGAEPPVNGALRLGGDGRAAAVTAVARALPAPDYETIAKAQRCRLVLTSPGLFADGWLPTGADRARKREDGAVRFDLHGTCGWIVCAAVPRAEVVSGWDLAHWQPKPALRAAPAGSVWWLELDEGIAAEALRKLAEAGLWREPCEDATRRAEGFNRIAVAAY